MKKTDRIGLIVFAILMGIAAACGVIIGAGIRNIEKQAIEKGHAGYNRQTGQFEWNPACGKNGHQETFTNGQK